MFVAKFRTLHLLAVDHSNASIRHAPASKPSAKPEDVGLGSLAAAALEPI
jgi:hypothetical protein